MSEASPLHDHHVRLGARFVDFGGWDMPIQYDSVLVEHRAVREAAGVFDVSHLGRLAVAGPGAADTLARIFSNDARKYAPGRTHYTTMLTEDGGILDDIVIWRWDEDEFWVMPNAANSPLVAGAIEDRSNRLTVVDLRPTTALLAVQGPAAPDILAGVLGEAPARFRTLESNGLRSAGTGYTGERGGEVCVEADSAAGLFEDLVAAGARPCGLGARDTLRLEAGLVLWSADIDATTTPLEAGLAMAVDWDHDFVGKEALEKQRSAGLTRRLSGLTMEGRGIPRAGYSVRAGDSEGVVTSGNISPILDTGIALAYLSPPVDEGADAEVEIRGTWTPARVTTPPFHRR
ncbi:glycine cleavage system aminomethyltransferase GcvT [soil metagenome]